MSPEVASPNGQWVAQGIGNFVDFTSFLLIWNAGVGWSRAFDAFADALSRNPVAINDNGIALATGCTAYASGLEMPSFGYITGVGCYDATNNFQLNALGVPGFGTPININNAGQVFMRNGTYPFEVSGTVPSAVPEPSTISLLVVAGFFVARRLWKPIARRRPDADL